MAGASPYWVRPAKDVPMAGNHLLLYTDERENRGVLSASVRRAWLARIEKGEFTLESLGEYVDANGLDGLLDYITVKSPTLTIWTMRGWSDLVNTGLAELIDNGAITWRYASLEGQNCLVRGAYRNKKVVITSLCNWTGGRWDGWKGVNDDVYIDRLLSSLGTPGQIGVICNSTDEVLAVRTLAAVVATCASTGLPSVPPTSAAAGHLAWRAWLAPLVVLKGEEKKPRGKRKGAEPEYYCAPIPQRPQHAAISERHVCYGMTNRQLRKGRADGPIYVADLTSAYLLGLYCSPLPVTYHTTLRKATPESLAESLIGHTGLALVRIESESHYYPCRINGRIAPTKGRFWTWLCGMDLVDALCREQVTEVYLAHIWIGKHITESARKNIQSISVAMSKHNMPAVATGWRAMYSALVGRFAGWQRIWVDRKEPTNFGRWATWEGADPDTGLIVPWRSIAGKVQLLREKIDKTDSVPLVFGIVTSVVRSVINSMVETVGVENVYCIAADSIWTNTDGWQRILKSVSSAGFPPDTMRVKDIYDRVYMNGMATAVAERQGKRILLMPGVHKGAVADQDGKVIVSHTSDWSGIQEPDMGSGVRLSKMRMDVARLAKKYDHAAIVIPPGETVDIPLLPEYLLQPIRDNRSIDNV